MGKRNIRLEGTEQGRERVGEIQWECLGGGGRV